MIDFKIKGIQVNVQKAPAPPPTYRVLENQNLYDLALQLYGDPTKVLDVAKGLGLNANGDPQPNQEVLINYNVATQAFVLNHYNVNSEIVSTKSAEKSLTIYLATEDYYILMTEDGYRLLVS